MKVQEDFAVQVERDYLKCAGELQTLINDKDFLLKAAQVEQMNQDRFGPSKVVQMRSETSQIAESVLSSARQELNKIRAEKKVALSKVVTDNQQPSGSGTQVLKKPLQQLMTACVLNSDTDISDDADHMSDAEVERELMRYEQQEAVNNRIVQSAGADEKSVPTSNVPKPTINAVNVHPEQNIPRSAVNVVNQIEHDDLRHQLQTKREPLHYRGAERPTPYRQGAEWKPNRALSCFNCNGRHAMSKCQLFGEMSVQERWARVQELRLCENCFSPLINEYGRAHICRSGICRRCRQSHHKSLLCEA